MKLIITLFSFLLIAELGFAQNVKLFLDLKQGEIYKQVVNAQSSINQTVAGNEMKIRMNITGQTDYLVTAIRNGNYDLDVNYKWLSMEMDMPNGKVSVDSRKQEENNVFSKILSQLIGKTFSVTMSKTGKVLEVHNIDAIFKSMFDNVSGISEDQKKQILSQLEQSYGEGSFRGNMEMATALYPESGVLTKEGWTVESKLQGGISADVKTTYKLVNATGATCQIAGVSTVTKSANTKALESNGMKMKIELDGSMRSDITVDRKTGWIISATVNQDFKGGTVVEKSEQMPQGMSIPMHLISLMTIKNN